jgi:hypothetical protein
MQARSSGQVCVTEHGGGFCSDMSMQALPGSTECGKQRQFGLPPHATQVAFSGLQQSESAGHTSTPWHRPLIQTWPPQLLLAVQATQAVPASLQTRPAFVPVQGWLGAQVNPGAGGIGTPAAQGLVPRQRPLRAQGLRRRIFLRWSRATFLVRPPVLDQRQTRRFGASLFVSSAAPGSAARATPTREATLATTPRRTLPRVSGVVARRLIRVSNRVPSTVGVSFLRERSCGRARIP